MRLTKMLGLAMVAAIAAMAFVGAGTASAAPDEVAICGVDPGASSALCSAGNILAQGKTILGVAGPSQLLGTINQECTSSHAAFTISSAGGMADELSLAPVGTGLSFSGCKPCEKVETAIGTAKLRHLSASGDFSLKGTGSAKLVNCTFGVDCKFEGTADLLVTLGATGSVIHAEGEELKRTEGNFLCGSTGKWDALYAVTGHWPALVTDLTP